MSLPEASVHMLWGLFISISGSATLRVMLQSDASILVAVPGLDLEAVVSNSVSTHTEPTPGTRGATSAGCWTGSWNRLWQKSFKLGMSCGLPAESAVRIGAIGYWGFHVVGFVSLKRCQLVGTVILKKVWTSLKIRSELE